MDKALIFFGIGFELVAMCLGGFFLGRHVDAYFGWQSMGSVGLILILLVGWFIHLFYLLRKMERDDEQGPGPSPQ